MHKFTKLAATGVAAAAIAVGAGVTPASAAPFNSYMTRTFTPWTSTWSQGASYWPINAGTAVNMQCWNTGASRDGTAKWFWVQSQAYPYATGYVPATDVGNQWYSSPHC